MYRERYTPWFTWLVFIIALSTAVGMMQLISDFLATADSAGAEISDDERVGYIIGISITGFVTVVMVFLVVFLKFGSKNSFPCHLMQQSVVYLPTLSFPFFSFLSIFLYFLL